jgi:hypothetical protein
MGTRARTGPANEALETGHAHPLGALVLQRLKLQQLWRQARSSPAFVPSGELLLRNLPMAVSFVSVQEEVAAVEHHLAFFSVSMDLLSEALCSSTAAQFGRLLWGWEHGDQN